jgi:UDP-N-acetyl-D-mannosaminouronate:lipid I N-acetyl-D-mannosaminouronosyltransferase
MESSYLNGLRVFIPNNRDELINFAFSEKKILVAVNAEKILHATPETRRIINSSIGYPDGIGAVWALRRGGFRFANKIPGVELWLEIIEKRHKMNSFYLVGGKEEVIQLTIQKLKSSFPGIMISGFRNGYVSDEEKASLLADIADKKPDVVFIAMGSPKQENLMSELQLVHPAVYQGLGGSFDVYTGRVERAPKWWLDNNLEWAYRLFKEPWRIKRQIKLIRFLKHLV